MTDQYVIVLESGGHGGGHQYKESRPRWWRSMRGTPMGDIDEADWSLEICDRVVQEMDALNDEKYTTYNVRDGDEYVGAEQRDDFADDVQADIVLSIHFNANTASSSIRGFQPYYLETDPEAERFSEIIWNLIPGPLSGYFRGPRKIPAVLDEDSMWLRAAKAVCETHKPRTCVLLECGFSTNKGDVAYATSEEGKEAVVKCIVEALVGWIGD